MLYFTQCGYSFLVVTLAFSSPKMKALDISPPCDTDIPLHHFPRHRGLAPQASVLASNSVLKGKRRLLSNTLKLTRVFYLRYLCLIVCAPSCRHVITCAHFWCPGVSTKSWYQDEATIVTTKCGGTEVTKNISCKSILFFPSWFTGITNTFRGNKNYSSMAPKCARGLFISMLCAHCKHTKTRGESTSSLTPLPSSPLLLYPPSVPLHQGLDTESVVKNTQPPPQQVPFYPSNMEHSFITELSIKFSVRAKEGTAVVAVVVKRIDLHDACRNVSWGEVSVWVIASTHILMFDGWSVTYLMMIFCVCECTCEGSSVALRTTVAWAWTATRAWIEVCEHM